MFLEGTVIIAHALAARNGTQGGRFSALRLAPREPQPPQDGARRCSAEAPLELGSNTTRDETFSHARELPSESLSRKVEVFRLPR